MLLATPPPPGLPALLPALPPLLRPFPDKLGHAALFLVQALLLHRALSPARGARRVEARALAATALVTVAFGGLTEVAQLVVPGRDADLVDLLADGLGVAGYVLWRSRRPCFFQAAMSRLPP